MKKAVKEKKELEKKIKESKLDLENKDKIIEEYKLKTKLFEKENQMNQRFNDINQKYVELSNKIDKLNKENNYLNQNDQIKIWNKKSDELENLISIILLSCEENIHHSFICKKTHELMIIEEKILEKYPELKEYQLIFLKHGKLLDKSKSLEFNHIDNSDIITLKIIRE